VTAPPRSSGTKREKASLISRTARLTTPQLASTLSPFKLRVVEANAGLFLCPLVALLGWRYGIVLFLSHAPSSFDLCLSKARAKKEPPTLTLDMVSHQGSGTKFLECIFCLGESHLRRYRDCYGLSGGGRLLFFSWQLIINTGTTIITFRTVFIIQNSQNRDGAAIQAKLDELIRASAAQNTLIGIEHLTVDEISEIHEKCLVRAKKWGAKEREQESASSD
jgi:low affinity Fe/Cu permease